MGDIVFDWLSPEKLSNALYPGHTVPVKEITDGTRTSYLAHSPEEAGEGSVELILLNNSFSIVILNCHWHQNTSFLVDDGDRVRLNFSLELDMVMEFDQSDEVDVNRPSWRFINNMKNSPVRSL